MKTQDRMLVWLWWGWLLGGPGVVSGLTAGSGPASPAEAGAARTLVVTTTADTGAGSLRQHLLDARAGDTIRFDPTVFRANAPASILLEDSLPTLSQGRITIDASDAGVFLDGSRVGEVPEEARFDDVRLTFNGGVNRLVNGDFSAGVQHWVQQDWGSGFLLRTNAATYTSAPAAGVVPVRAHDGYVNLFYQQADRADTDPGWPPDSATGTVWLAATPGTSIELTFQYQTVAPATAFLMMRMTGGGWRDLATLSLTPGGAAWSLGRLTGTLPADGNAVGVRLEVRHSRRWVLGLHINSAGNTLRGLQFVRWPGHGLELGSGASNNVLGGSRRLGTGPVGQGLLSSLNGGNGINAWGTTRSNVIRGCLIGTDPTGTLDWGNLWHGISLWNGAQGYEIGGSTDGEGNLISGNGFEHNWVLGLLLNGPETRSNRVVGNFIGVDLTGRQALGNHGPGVEVSGGSGDNVIGGNRAAGSGPLGEGNAVSGNAHSGLNFLNASGNRIRGNFVGTDVTGTGRVPNLGHAVAFWDRSLRNVVGSTNATEGNVIGGNGDSTHWTCGVVFHNSSSNLVVGNFIGASAAGAAALENTGEGVHLVAGSQENVVGGTEVGAGNVISGNASNGVGLYHENTRGNRVLGNRIGVDVSGRTSVGNLGCGVNVGSGASDNTVGGATVSARNVIGGNRLDGVALRDAGTANNRVVGNFIGTDLEGTRSLGNGYNGVLLVAGCVSNRIGGALEGEGNLISGNGYQGQPWSNGLFIANEGTVENRVLGNYIGTDVTGMRPLPNNGNGIHLCCGASSNQVGGSAPGEVNLISGNSNTNPDWGADGLTITDAGTRFNRIFGNAIGLDAAGAPVLGNSGQGINLFGGASDTAIGGTGAGEGNTMAGNRWNGVNVFNAASLRNRIAGNRVYANGGRGIALGDGANQAILPPTLVSLSTDTVGGLTGAGQVVEVFSDADDEGRYFEGAVVADAAGRFALTKPGGFTAARVTATTTDTAGNTSEFANHLRPGAGFYQSGFDLGAGREWSGARLDTTPVGGRRFLGRFGNETVTLSLAGLPPHNTVVVAADLYLFQSWDGNGEWCCGPDVWQMQEVGGAVVMRTTFGTHEYGVPRTQAYPLEVGQGAFRVPAGAIERHTLGYFYHGDVPMDAVFRPTRVLAHAGDRLEIAFSGSGLQELGDESWGLDNVTVWVAEVPANAAPAILVPPQDQTRRLGDHAFFQVAAAGSGTLRYQWRKAGMAIAGETNAFLVLAEVTASSAAAYSVAVSNDYGSTLSPGARLSVIEPTVHLVTVTNDIGPGSLRAALGAVQMSDSIRFSPAVFPPANPARIVVSNPLPTLVAGNVTVDGSDAGVILDGRGIGSTPESTRFDDVRLTLDGGPNLLVNGDFSGGLAHWGSYDDTDLHTRALDAAEFVSGPQSLEIRSTAGARTARTFYDTAARTVAFPAFPAGDAASTIWVAAQPGQRVALEFQHQSPGGGTAYILALHQAGWWENLAVLGLPSGQGTWRRGELSAVVPADGTAVAVQFDSIHRQRWNLGWVLKSARNTLRGLQIVNFPANAIWLDACALENVLGGDRTLGTGPLGQGLLVSGNGAAGIGFWTGSGGNRLQGSYVGTDAAGSAPWPNFYEGVIVHESPGNVIGGPSPGQRNVISGNRELNLAIRNPQSSNNVVVGNFIGTDASGARAIGGGNGGVGFYGGARFNRLGGTSPGEANVISGNRYNGVWLNEASTTHNLILGNLIGTDLTGANALGNGGEGVRLENGAAFNRVGGAEPGARNLISGNGSEGVEICCGARSNVVAGNFVGLDASGTRALGNGGNGIWIAGAYDNRIGGPAAGDRNVIGGNGTTCEWCDGVFLSGSATNNIVQGNDIGSDVTGTQALGNRSHGIDVFEGAADNWLLDNLVVANGENGIGIWNNTSRNVASGNYVGVNAAGSLGLGNRLAGIALSQTSRNNRIGGDQPGEGNVIAQNGGDGVVLRDATTFGNTISGNSIHDNGGLGINLESGANQNVVPPQFTAIGPITVSGTTGAAGRIELFSDDGSEGRVYEGGTVLEGPGEWRIIQPAGFTGPRLTATLTDANGNTSEFRSGRALSSPYGNDFAEEAGPEWSAQDLTTAPSGARRFLGRFASQTVTLTLTNLPPHTHVELAFDLLIMRAMDGSNGGDVGPDVFDVSVLNGPSLLHTSFATHSVETNRLQSFPETFPNGLHPPHTGAAETNTLGYTWDWRNYALWWDRGIGAMDAVYPLVFSFPHTTNTIQVRFALSSPEASVDDESWGLDNVVLKTVTLPANAPPEIVAPPRDRPVATGADAVFRVVARGADPLVYQWSKDGTVLPGATNALLLINQVTPADAGRYRVEVRNAHGQATSADAVLTPWPSLVGQPMPHNVRLGSGLTLAAAALGPGPLTYQWARDGAPLAGATNAALVFGAVTANEAGVYTVSVTGPTGNVTSVPARIQVLEIRGEAPEIVWQRGGHYGDVRCAAWSPDGRWVATGSGIDYNNSSRDLTIKIWRVADRALVRTFTAHQRGITAMAFSPDGAWLATGSEDKTVKLWDYAGGRLVHTFAGHTSGIRSVAFAPDSTVLASASDDETVKLWDLANGALRAAWLAHRGGAKAVAFSADGQRLVTGGGDRWVRLWSATDGALAGSFSGHGDGVTAVAVTPDGNRVVAGSHDDTVRVWNAATGAPVYRLTGFTNSVNAIALAPDGSTVAAASSDESIRIWYLANGGLQRTLKGHTEPVLTLAYAPDGRHLVSGGEFPDPSIRLWRTTDGAALGQFQNHINGVNGVVFSPDGETVVSGAWSSTIEFWGAADGQRQRTIANGAQALAYAPDGRVVVSGHSGGEMHVWSAADGTRLRTLTGHTGGVNDLAVSPDSVTLASASGDNSVKLWRLADGGLVRTLTGHGGAVNAVVYAPSGARLASGSADQTIRLWNPATGALQRRLTNVASPINALAFSPNSALLASAHDNGVVQLWNPATGAAVRRITAHTDRVLDLAFTRDGAALVSAGWDSTIKFWRVSDGALLHHYDTETFGMRELDVSPSGDRFAYARHDATVVVALNPLTLNPPVITAPPHLELAGGDAVFEVEAVGTAPLHYQWRRNGTDLEDDGHVTGARTPSLRISGPRPGDAGAYSVVISNLTGFLVSSAVPLVLSDSAGALVYGEDFELGAGVEWSLPQTEVTPVGARRFLGQFGNQAVTLTLNGLPPHDTLVLSLDLFIIRTWDGIETTTGGPDVWQASVVQGPTLVRTTFVTHDHFSPRYQSFPGAYPGADRHRIFTGANEVNTLGFLWDWRPYPDYADRGLVPMDCVYRLTLIGSHTGPTAVLRFAGIGLEPISNESWGLDNVAVSVRSTMPGSPPDLVKQPEDQRIPATEEAVFSVAATGLGPFRYQWKWNGAVLAGATNSVLIVPGTRPNATGLYSVEVSNDAGSTTSRAAALRIVPTILAWPGPAAVPLGTAVTFLVEAAGSPPLTYQWRKDGVPLSDDDGIAGSKTPSLTLEAVGSADLGDYDVVVSNPHGTSVSPAAALLAEPSAFSWVVAGQGAQDAHGRGVVADAAGNACTVGEFLGTVGFGGIPLTSAGSNDVFIVRTDAAGAIAWARRAGGTGHDLARDVAMDGQGNAYVVGWFSGTASFGSTNLVSRGGTDVFLAKYDPQGDLVWATSAGGTLDDYGYGVAVNSEGRGRLTGHFAGTAAFGSQTFTSRGAADAFVARFTEEGTFVWARQAGGAGSDEGHDVALDADGNCWLTGSFTGPVALGLGTFEGFGALDIFVARLDSAGNWLWVRGAGGPADYETGWSVAVDSAGNGYVGGKFVGPSLFGATVLPGAGDQDGFVARFSAEGELAWVRSIGGTGIDIVPNVAVDPAGHCYVTGLYGGAQGRPAWIGSVPLTSRGDYDLFVTKIDPQGVTQWITTAGGSGQDWAYAIAAPQPDVAFVTGWFSGSAVFGPHPLSSSGAHDAFLARLGPTPPSILSPPQDLAVELGAAATFAVSATGTLPLTYRWQRDGVDLIDGGRVAGATTPTLQLADVQVADEGLYRVRVANSAGSVTSPAARLTVLRPPEVVVPPTSQTVAAGSDLVLAVEVRGPGPYLYQWLRNGVPLDGAVGATLDLADLEAGQGGRYSVVVRNPFGAVESAPAVVRVTLPALAFADTFGDQGRIRTAAGSGWGENVFAGVEPGEAVHAGKAGGHSVWLTWQAPATGIATLRTAGSAFDTLLAVYTGAALGQLVPVASDEDRGGFLTSEVRFRAEAGVDYEIAVDGFGGATGDIILTWSLEVTEEPLPVIVRHPARVTVEPSSTVTFDVEALGAGLTYQWYRNGQPLDGRTTPSVTFSNVDRTYVGAYTVRVTNPAGRTTESRPAQCELAERTQSASEDKLADLLEAGGVGGEAALAAGETGAVSDARLAGPSGATVGSRVRLHGPFASVSLGAAGISKQLHNFGAHTEPGEPVHGGEVVVGSLWEVVEPDAAGTLAIEASSDEVDPVVAVYTMLGPVFEGYDRLKLEGASSGPAVASVRLSAAAKRLYLVAVGARKQPPGSARKERGLLRLGARLGQAPVIAVPLADRQVNAGQTLTLTTLAAGVPDPAYQWYFGDQMLGGQTASSLVLSALHTGQSGRYRCVASNFAGAVETAMVLTVVDVPLAWSGWQLTAEGRLRLTVPGHATRATIVQASEDLAAWTDVFVNLPGSGPAAFTDPEAVGHSLRFYRLKQF